MTNIETNGIIRKRAASEALPGHYRKSIDCLVFFLYCSLVLGIAGTMNRRDLLKGAALLPAVAAASDVPAHLWQGYEFGAGPPVRDRLNQGPFDIDQDQGWQTVLFTTPSEQPLRNPGLGL